MYFDWTDPWCDCFADTIISSAIVLSSIMSWDIRKGEVGSVRKYCVVCGNPVPGDVWPRIGSRHFTEQSKFIVFYDRVVTRVRGLQWWRIWKKVKTIGEFLSLWYQRENRVHRLEYIWNCLRSRRLEALLQERTGCVSPSCAPFFVATITSRGLYARIPVRRSHNWKKWRLNLTEMQRQSNVIQKEPNSQGSKSTFIDR